MKMKMKLFENEYDFWTPQLEISLYNNFPNHGKNKDEDETSKNECNCWTLHPQIRRNINFHKILREKMF